MAAPCYIAWNSALPTTGPITAVATANATKSLLQVAPGTPKIRVVEWGYSVDVVPTALLKMELVVVNVTFGSGGTSVTPSKYNDCTGAASSAAALFTATTEGTITTARTLAYEHEWNQQFKQQFPLGREPEVNAGEFLRIRATTTVTTMNVSCYIVWEE